MGIFEYFNVSSHMDTRFIPFRGNCSSFVGAAHLSRYNYVIKKIFKGRRQKWNVLDFGCGGGYGAAILANYSRKAYGMDISSVAIAYAKRKYQKSNLKFLVGDVTKKESINKLKGIKFDLIVSFDVIEHLKDYKTYLNNAFNLLSRKGELVLGTPNKLMTLKYNRAMNSHHIKEFTPVELKHEIKSVFPHVKVIGQGLKSKFKNSVQKKQRFNLFIKIIRKMLEILDIPSFLRVQLTMDDIVFRRSNIKDGFGVIAIARKM